MEGAARPRDLPRQRRARQGRLPLHRPGLAVREHAGRAAADRADRRRHVRRGGRDHAAAARRARAVGHHLRRSRGRGRRRGAAHAHGDHAARGADRRYRADAPAGRLRHRARLRHGPLARRVRRARRRRDHVVRGRAGGRERPRARDGQPRPSATRARWPPSRRRSKRSSGSSRRSTATSCSPTSTRPTSSCWAVTPTRSTRRSRSSSSAVSGRSAFRSATRSTPRLVAGVTEPLRATLQRHDAGAGADPGGGQRGRRVLPDRARRRGADHRHPRPPGRLAGPIRQGSAHPVRRGRAGARGNRPQTRTVGIRRRRAGRRCR